MSTHTRSRQSNHAASKLAPDLPPCPRCTYFPLRLCAARDAACAHCDHCGWAGDPRVRQDARPRRLAAPAAAEPVDFIEYAIADAQRHGEESDDPDHEVGDLQGLAYAMWKVLTPAQKATVIREVSPFMWTPPQETTPAPPAIKRARRQSGKGTR